MRSRKSALRAAARAARSRYRGTRLCGPEPLERRELLSATLQWQHVFLDPHTKVPSAIAPHGDTSPSGWLTPQMVRKAYGIDSIGGGDGSGQTIAIVDAYDDPYFVDSADPGFLASDLHQFDAAFNLPDPSFRKIDQNGEPQHPGVDPSRGWESEIALDVEWAHAMAPGANIVLVEANSESDSDMFKAVNTARNLPGVSVVSMSWGAGEYAGETAFDSILTTPAGHPGVTFLAATGDHGAPGGYPAYSPGVVAVGGTSLTVGSDGSYTREDAWSLDRSGWGTGGGQSALESEPSFQQGVQQSGWRQTPDVSFDAITGVAVYDTFTAGAAAPWLGNGGTSLAAPCWGGLIAIANQLRVAQGSGTLDGLTQTLPALYALPDADFHDITSGNNGGISALPGFDMVTGRGSPLANKLVPDLAAFALAPVVLSISPSLAGGTLAAGTTQLTIQFSKPVTGADVPTNYQLRGAGGDGLLGTVDDNVVTPNVVTPNGVSSSGTTATLTFAPLPEEVYRLTIADTIIDAAGHQLDGDGDGTAPGGDFSTDFVVVADATPPVTLYSSHGLPFDVAVGGLGAGQIVQGFHNAYDGDGRLTVDGQAFEPDQLTYSLADSGQSVVIGSGTCDGLTVSRKITVPSAGSEDFVRTVDAFTNPSGALITTTVEVVGNLGSNAGTAVFTADGDNVVEPSDQWIGTYDRIGNGTLPVIHYLHGPTGLQPDSVQVSGDNISWTYTLKVAAGQTVRLASFTIFDMTQAWVTAAADALVTASGFAGEAAAGLTPAELQSLANFGSSVNAAPLLAPVKPSLGTTSAITWSTLPLSTFINHGPGTTTITDAGNPAAVGGIALVGATGRGQWSYSLDGVVYYPVGTLDPAAALRLPASATLRYTPDMQDAETATISYRAWEVTPGAAGTLVDTTSSGAATLFSTDLDTASLGVTAPAPVTLSSTQWTSLGPALVTGSATPGNQPVAGEVSALAVDPTDANTFYVGAGGGGVWKTTDGGQTYTPLTDGQYTLSTGSIAIAPSNHNVLYVGTGEGNSSINSYYGYGILKSIDGGLSWTTLDNYVFDRAAISKIVVDPTNADVVYAVVTIAEGSSPSYWGIWKSTDGGYDWNYATPASSDPNFAPIFTDLVIDPVNPQILYAAAGYAFAASYSPPITSNGVYESTDGGTTWSLAGNFPTGDSLNGRITLAMAPSSPHILYASIADASNFTLRQMLRTTDGGATWSTLSGVPDYLKGSGWYATALIVDPANPDIVYAAGQAGGNSILRSGDGGQTWGDIAIGVDGNGPLGNHHTFAFAHGRLLDGDNGGIWRLDSAKLGDVHWTDLNGNAPHSLGTVQFSSIALDPTNSKIVYGGTQSGTARYNGSVVWTQFQDGTAGTILVDSQNPSIIYRIYYDLLGRLSLARSDDGGDTWVGVATGIDAHNDGFVYKQPFVMDPGNASRLLFGTSEVYETTDKGATWTAISPTFAAHQWIDALGMGPGGDTIYAAVGSQIEITKDHGKTWTSVTPVTTSSALTFAAIEVDPTDANIVYISAANFYTETGGGVVWRSTDGGATWTDMSGGLYGIPCRALALDPRGPGSADNVLYAGTDYGVYDWSASNQFWLPLGSGLPNAVVRDLKIDTHNKILAAATFGRGLWEISLPDPAPVATVSLSSHSPYTNAILTATATASDPNGALVSLNYVWSVNGVVKQTHTSTALTDSFDLRVAGNGDQGDVIMVAVTPNDGTFSGSTVTDTATVASSAPTVAAVASATPDAVIGTATSLSVLGADIDTDEGSLTYTWAATTLPDGAPSPAFSANGTNAARNTTASFQKAGSYTLEVTITDPGGLTATSCVIVTVSQAPTSITLSPLSAVSYGHSVTFTATVTPASGAFDNGGTVQFAIDGTNFGSPQDLSGGSASIQGPSLGVGNHVITASYSGDSDFAASTTTAGPDSLSTTLAVSPVTPSVSVTDAGGIYNGSPSAVTAATVTGVAGDGTLASLSQNSGTLSFTYYQGVTSLGSTAPTDAGAYTVVARYTSDNGNYNSAESTARAFTVTPAALQITVDNKSKVYGQANPPLTGTVQGILNGDAVTVNYATSAAQYSDVQTGGYAISVASLTGAKALDYSIDPGVASGASVSNGTLAVTPAALQITVDNKSKVYGQANPPLTGTVQGILNGDAVTVNYATSAAQYSDVQTGGYAISVASLTGAKALDYSDDPGVASGASVSNGTLAVTPAALQVTVDNKSKVYGQANPPLTGTVQGILNGDAVTVNYATSAAQYSDVHTGGYAISVASLTGAKALDYSDDPGVASGASVSNGTLAVTPAALQITVDNKSKVYGQANPPLTGTVQGILNGDAVTVNYATSATQYSDVQTGGYAISVASLTGAKALDYSIDPGVASGASVSNGTLAVTPAALQITVDNKSKVYGQANPLLTGTVQGILNGDAVTVNYATSATQYSDVQTGGYAISVASLTGAKALDYSDDPGVASGASVSNGTLAVTPAALQITVDNKSKVYGQANPPLTGTVQGILNGDAVTVNYATSATQYSDVQTGGYAISVASLTGAKALDYSDDPGVASGASVSNGTLAVTPAALQITVDNKSKVYGQANPPLTGTVQGILNGDAVTVNYATSATQYSDVQTGGYAISVASLTGAKALDYSIDPGVASGASVSNGTLAVTPAALQVTVDNKSKVYGQANPLLTGTVQGILNGDAVTVNYATSAAQYSDVHTGGYAISVASLTGAKALDYSIDPGVASGASVSNGTLAVTPAAPMVASVVATQGPVVGGTAVTISGTNLTGATAVMFGALPATSFTVNSPLQIRAISPAEAAGSVDITVITAGGTSATSSADQFTYVVAPVSPEAPTGTTASDGTYTDHVVVAWNAASGVDGYLVYRSTTNNLSTAQLSYVTSSTSVNDALLTPGTTYYYWVQAYKVAAGTYYYSPFSAGDSGYALNPIPPAPMGVTASKGTYGTKVALSWGDVSGEDGYLVYRNATNNSATAQFSFLTAANVTTVDDTYAAPGTTYYYWVQAYKVVAGTYYYGAFSAVDAGVRLGAPTGLTASKGTDGTKVALSWGDVSGEDGYLVYRNTTNNSATAQFSFLTAANVTTVDDTYAASGTTYYYWVQSYKVVAGAYCYSAFSAVDAGVRLGVPTGLTASKGTYSTKVALSWGDVSGEDGYLVYRNTTNNLATAQFSFLTAANVTSVDDTYAAPGTGYYYWVQSYKLVAGTYCYSAFSGVDAGVRLGVPTGLTAGKGTYGTKVVVSWGDVSGEDGYLVYRNTTNNLATAQFSFLTAANVTTVDDSYAASGTTYYYWVQAYKLVAGTYCYSTFSGMASGYRS